MNRFYDLSLNSEEKAVTDSLYCDYPIIVSLTTYGKRIQDVSLVIESLIHQTIKPNKLVLCLGEEMRNSVPVTVEKQRERGLEIIFCEDIRSYTKLIPTLRKYPQSVLVTVDDDIIYPCDFLENLVKAYLRDKTKVYFYYGHTIMLNSKGGLEPYRKWVKNSAKGSSLFNLPTGVNGVLYPPGCFFHDIDQKDIFLTLCPYADDLWFKCMTLLKGIECEQVERLHSGKSDFVHLGSADNSALSKVNNDKGMNDVQALRLFSKYELNRVLNIGKL